MAPSAPQHRRATSRPESWAPLSLTEETPVAAHGLLNPHDAERVPQRRRLAGHHGLAQIALEPLDDSGRVQPGSTDEDGVRVSGIGRAPKRVGARLWLLV